MNRTAEVAVAVGIALVAAVGLTALVHESHKEKEFACYYDGHLTERHVGVQHATRSGVTWTLKYVDGQGVDRVTYVQRPGETCQTEVIPDKGDAG